MNIRSRQLMVAGIGVLVVALTLSGVFWHGFRVKRTLAATRREQPVLRVGRHVVGGAEFREAQNRFFKRWERDAYMLRLNDEERNDRLLEELINQIAIEEYLKQQIKVDQAAVTAYINRYIKTKYATEAELGEYLDSIGCQRANLTTMVGNYLAKIRYIPQLARQSGITVNPDEVDQAYQQQKNQCDHSRNEIADMLLMEKFVGSAQFQSWQKSIKAAMKITVLNPELRAYRCFKARKYQTAGALYESIYRLDQREFYLKRALESYYLAGNWDYIIKLGNYGSRQFADKAPYYLSAAEGFYHKRQIHKALGLLKKAETLAADNRVLQQMVAEAYARMGFKQN